MEKVYPRQIYEPIRIKIACEVIQKELRKLLPSVPERLWSDIDKDIVNWFEGSKSELASVHDFWNGFEGITQGFKLKKILPYLTAENISWSKKKIPIKNIIFTTNLPILSFLTKVPFRVKILIDFVKNDKNQDKVKEIRINSDKHASSSVPRDDYPIIVVKEKNDYKLLDGHRRVIRKVLFEEKDVESYVGKYISDERQPKNYWVSTGFLRDLVKIKDLHQEDQKLHEAVDIIIDYLKHNHQNAAYILPLRVLKRENRIK